eukprot:5497016-Prymnesium_polylepis.1
MSWRMGERAVFRRRSAERVVRGGGRCSRFYMGVSGVKLVSVKTVPTSRSHGRGRQWRARFDLARTSSLR